MRVGLWLLAILVLVAALPALTIGAHATSSPVKHHPASTKHAQALHAKHRAVFHQLEGEDGDAEEEDETEDEKEKEEEKQEKAWWQKKDDEGLSNLTLVMFVFGFVVMVVAAVFFLVMALRYDGEADTRRHGPMFFYLVFFVTSISAMTYYSMWTETSVLHVEQEGDDEDKRTIFPARYIDWIVTTPLMLATVSLLGNAPTSSLVAMIGSDLLFFSSLYIGAVQTAGHKWFWWGVGVFFFIMLVYFMLVELSKVDTGRVKEYDADTLRMLTYFFIICWAFFPLLWLFGQEGTAASSLPVQAAFTTLADLTAKIAFGLIVVFRSQPDYTEYVPERDPQRVVTSSAFV